MASRAPFFSMYCTPTNTEHVFNFKVYDIRAETAGLIVEINFVHFATGWWFCNNAVKALMGETQYRIEFVFEALQV